MKRSLGGVPVRLTPLTVLVLLLCVGGLGYAGYDYTQQSQALDDAVAVNATVVETDIEEDTVRRGVEYDVTVVFTYEYEGTQYRSDRLYPTTFGQSFETESKAESVLAPYEDNETATAYVEPGAPDEGFLQARRTNDPLWFGAGAGGLLVVTVLNAVGARTPGQETGIAPAEERESAAETLLGVDRDRINWLSKRVIVGGWVVFILSLLGTVLTVATADADIEASVTDPVGLTVLTALVSYLAVIGGVLLYGIWSFGEYRRLRRYLPEPRPPSPFVRPTRVVTILGTDSDALDDYGQRVKRTGFAAVGTLFLLGVLAQFFV